MWKKRLSHGKVVGGIGGSGGGRRGRGTGTAHSLVFGVGVIALVLRGGQRRVGVGTGS